jgi:hypothetical protein
MKRLTLPSRNLSRKRDVKRIRLKIGHVSRIIFIASAIASTYIFVAIIKTNNQNNDPSVGSVEDYVVSNERTRTSSIDTSSIVKQEIPLSSTISMVISHCDKPLQWVTSYIGDDHDISDITIITKCGKEIEGLSELKQFAKTVQILSLPNLGRCDHSYSYWISRDLSQKDPTNHNESDVVVFLKDNDYLKKSYHSFDTVYSTTSNTGFSCLLKPTCFGRTKRFCKKFTPLMLHNRTTVEHYTINEYSRLARDENNSFLSNYTSVVQWTGAMGLNLPDTALIPVCYGGAFATTRKQFSMQSVQVWEKVTSSLARDNNIAEGHYAERSWANILFPIDILKELTTNALPYLAYEMKGEYGAVGMSFARKDFKDSSVQSNTFNTLARRSIN